MVREQIPHESEILAREWLFQSAIRDYMTNVGLHVFLDGIGLTRKMKRALWHFANLVARVVPLAS